MIQQHSLSRNCSGKLPSDLRCAVPSCLSSFAGLFHRVVLGLGKLRADARVCAFVYEYGRILSQVLQPTRGLESPTGVVCVTAYGQLAAWHVDWRWRHRRAVRQVERLTILQKATHKGPRIADAVARQESLGVGV